MKTPQEEAEFLIHKTVQPVMFFTETQHRLEKHLAETIPLAELIAVASAAAQNSCRHDITIAPEQCETCVALRTLRATGKVEL